MHAVACYDGRGHDLISLQDRLGLELGESGNFPSAQFRDIMKP